MQASANINQLSPNASVMTIAWIEGQPVSAPCRVHAQAPLYLRTSDPFIQRQSFPLFGTMLWEEEGRIVRADAELSSIQPFEAGSLIEVRGIRSEPLDRRRFPRVSVDASVSMKVVDDSDGDMKFEFVQGRLVDLSQGGAHIRLADPLEEGTLFEFNAKSDEGELVQSLAVVITRTSESMGIAFLDQRPTTSDNLRRWIEKAA